MKKLFCLVLLAALFIPAAAQKTNPGPQAGRFISSPSTLSGACTFRGMVRYDTTSSSVKVCNGSSWVDYAPGGGGSYTAGTGVTIAGSVISIGQSVATTSTPTFAQATLTQSTNTQARLTLSNTFAGSPNGQANAEIVFSTNGGSGSFSMDFSGNMVFRNSGTAKGTYFDYSSSGIIFRNSSFATKLTLSDAGVLALTGNQTVSGTLDITAGATVGKTAATATAGATYTIDFSVSPTHRITFGAGNITSLTATNIPGSSSKSAIVHITLIQDGTGSRTAAWNTSIFKFSGGQQPILSTGAGKIDKFSFDCNGTACELIGGVLDVR